MENEREKWTHYFIFNRQTGMIVERGYCSVKDLIQKEPKDQGLQMGESDIDADPGAYFVVDGYLEERPVLEPQISGATITLSEGATMMAHTEPEQTLVNPFVHHLGGQCGPYDLDAGSTYLNMLEKNHPHRLQINAWPHLEWEGVILPSDNPADADQIIDVVWTDSIAEYKFAAIKELNAAKKRSIARFITPGVDVLYAEKRADIAAWKALGSPMDEEAFDDENDQTLAQLLPNVSGYSQATGKELPDACKAIENIVDGLKSIAARISNISDFGNAAVSAAISFDEVARDRDFHIEMLEQVRK